MLGTGGSLAGRKLRLRQAARIAGVHRDTIVRWQNAGYLTDHRTNGMYRRVDEDELQALLAKRRREAYDRTAK